MNHYCQLMGHEIHRDGCLRGCFDEPPIKIVPYEREGPSLVTLLFGGPIYFLVWLICFPVMCFLDLCEEL